MLGVVAEEFDDVVSSLDLDGVEERLSEPVVEVALAELGLAVVEHLEDGGDGALAARARRLLGREQVDGVGRRAVEAHVTLERARAQRRAAGVLESLCVELRRFQRKRDRDHGLVGPEQIQVRRERPVAPDQVPELLRDPHALRGERARRRRLRAARLAARVVPLE